MRALRRLWRREAGASAVEFTLVLPAFLALTIGTINLCLMLWANAGLNFAVERAARCMSVNTNSTNCATVAETETYAASIYSGPSISPTFTAVAATDGSCGNQVSAAASYQLNIILARFTVPMSASSCFPSQT